MRHSFYLGRKLRGVIQWSIFLAFIILANLHYAIFGKKTVNIGNTLEGNNSILQTLATVAGLIVFCWFWYDIYLLFTGKLKDIDGKTITTKSGCPNCDCTEFRKIETKVLRVQMVKVKVEKITQKHYDKKGRILGYTKGVSEEDRKHRYFENYFECLYCNHTWKIGGVETSKY